MSFFRKPFKACCQGLHRKLPLKQQVMVASNLGLCWWLCPELVAANKETAVLKGTSRIGILVGGTCCGPTTIGPVSICRIFVTALVAIPLVHGKAVSGLTATNTSHHHQTKQKHTRPLVFDWYRTTLVLHHRPQEYSRPLSLLRCLCLFFPWLKPLSSPGFHSLIPSQASW